MTLLLAALLAALSVMNRLGADRWWFGALNLYLPQAAWATPGVILTLALLLVNRRFVWAPLLCVAWVAGPLMGLSWSLQTPPAPGRTTLRVMTWNVKYGARSRAAIFDEIKRHRPDLVLLQDAPGLLESPEGDFFRGWQVRSYGQFVIAGRLPLEDATAEWLDFPGQAGGEACLRCRLRIAGTTVTLYNVHLHSPRQELSLVPLAVKKPPIRDLTATMLKSNATSRHLQAHRLAALLLQERGPVIVAGDLNAPDSSLVCDTLRTAGVHDAFAEGGRGYGYTYGHFLIPDRLPLPKFSFVRIDHIMLGSRIRAARCWTGTADASDHRPVCADLELR